MKLSVCMITYNHEGFVAEAIEGALAQQTDFDFEIVVGEDCSTDSTRKIVAEYQRKHPDRIRTIFRDKNVGMMENFTQTILACRGQYIALIEGDDFWTWPLKLQEQADFLDAHPECSACYHNVNVVDEANPEQNRLYYKKPPKPLLFLEDLITGNTIHTCSMVFRAGLFDEFPKWYFSMPMGDWPLYVLNAHHGPIGYIDGVYATYRMHHNGIWSSMSAVEIWEKSILAAQTLNAGLNFSCDSVIRKQIGSWQHILARMYCEANNYSAARRHARNCLRASKRGDAMYDSAFKLYWRTSRKAVKFYLKSKWKNLIGYCFCRKAI